MPNTLEEELRAVQTTKEYWRKKLDTVKDDLEKKQILSKLYALSDEESRILSELDR